MTAITRTYSYVRTTLDILSDTLSSVTNDASSLVKQSQHGRDVRTSSSSCIVWDIAKKLSMNCPCKSSCKAITVLAQGAKDHAQDELGIRRWYTKLESIKRNHRWYTKLLSITNLGF
jgi:hypothetical protein